MIWAGETESGVLIYSARSWAGTWGPEVTTPEGGGLNLAVSTKSIRVWHKTSPAASSGFVSISPLDFSFLEIE